MRRSTPLRAWLAALMLAAALPLALGSAWPLEAADVDARARTDQLALLINRARASEGLRPLARSPALDKAAEQHSRDMADHSYLDHAAPDGSEPMDRAIKAGYGARPGTGWIVVEVISAISDQPEGPLKWWLEESPNVHGRVLRNPRWREIGLGYAAGGEYGNYWTVLVGCQPGVLPSVTLDGKLFQHVEECDASQVAPAAPPDPPATATPAALHLLASAGADALGARRVEVRWLALPEPRSTDWIGLFRVGDPNGAYLAWSYLTCAASPLAANGTCALTVPPAVPAGEYEVRLLRDGGFADLARSERVTLPASAVIPSIKLSTDRAVVRTGERLSVTWSDLSPASPRDWLGLHSADRADLPPAAWLYVSCGSAPNEARPEGTCDLTVPADAQPGRYEVRLFADDGYAPLAAVALSIAPPS